MFLFEGDQLSHETVIHGVKYVTVSHYSGERDIFEVIGGLITVPFVHQKSTNLRRDLLWIWIWIWRGNNGIVCFERG